MFARPLASHVALAGVAVAFGLLLLGGVALAALDPAPFGARPAFDPTIGTSPLAEDGKGERAKRFAQVLDRLVANGTITAEQRAKILAALEELAKPGREPALKRFAGNLLAEATRIIGADAGTLRQELPGRSLAQVAANHGVSRETLVTGLVAEVNANLEKALANGKLTKEQADKMKTGAPDFVSRFVDHVWPQQRKSPQRRDGKAFLGEILQDAARVIGIGVGELRTQLPGKSLAQVAQSHNVSRDTLVERLRAAITARVDEAVRATKLTQQHADRIKADLPQTIAKQVDRVVPARAAP
jgi:uncharacterized protein YidB (DUF937 family)